MRILIIDNYDSFTYNLFQYVAEVGKVVPQVVYNDKFSLQEFTDLSPHAVIISPGPGNPTNNKDFGISAAIIKHAQVPLLGVCLGHQGIGTIFGAKIIPAFEVMHGRTSKIYHDGKGLFAGIPQGFEAVRYHSLIIDQKNLPHELEVTACTDRLEPKSIKMIAPFTRKQYKNIEIMGIQHKTRPVYGVQFHPESIGTAYGKKIIANFLDIVKNI